MKIKSVEINNYRLLEDLSDSKNNLKGMDLDDKTTVLVGKNNSGKTSFSYLFDVFLNNRPIRFHDFSLNTHKKFFELYEEYKAVKSSDEELNSFLNKAIEIIPKIQLILTIKYDEKDNWSNLRELLTSLDESDTFKVVFEYKPKSIDEFFKELEKECSANESKENVIESIKKIIDDNYNTLIRPWSPDDDAEPIKLKTIKSIINSCFICAQRDVADSNTMRANKLSDIFQQEYQTYDNNELAATAEQGEISEKLNLELEKMNKNIDDKLDCFFKSFIMSFSRFGYPNIEGSDIMLKSNIHITNIFSSILLFYKNNEYLLPEEYNGLGYSNLIYIISEILNFKTRIQGSATDLNIIFLEEPEAHMHPQLQSTFITNLNTFLNENGINVQVVLTTHSPHMVSNADFESIRYFSRDKNKTIIKDLMKFKPTKKLNVDKEEIINFLKQYITQVKCDMFFADKIILIEGTCERLLMPLFIDKVDKVVGEGVKPLKEQYISLIEINGAYMYNFKEFIEFLDVKTLIITDVDSCRKKNNGRAVNIACEIKKEYINDIITTNQTLKQWKPKEIHITNIINKKMSELIDEKIGVTYQRNYYYDDDRIKCGRTFEEAFIIDNAKYINDNRYMLKSIKNHLKSYRDEIDIFTKSYNLYSFIDRNNKKSQFAFDLMHVNSTDWLVPSYIKEGLLWLMM